VEGELEEEEVRGLHRLPPQEEEGAAPKVDLNLANCADYTALGYKVPRAGSVL
jgi:hypothetical protein